MSDQHDALSRTILPIPDRPHVGLTTYDAKNPDTKFPPIEPLRPPKGAPNVLIVLIDDCGFAAWSGNEPRFRARCDFVGEEMRKVPCPLDNLS